MVFSFYHNRVFAKGPLDVKLIHILPAIRWSRVFCIYNDIEKNLRAITSYFRPGKRPQNRRGRLQNTASIVFDDTKPPPAPQFLPSKTTKRPLHRPRRHLNAFSLLLRDEKQLFPARKAAKALLRAEKRQFRARSEAIQTAQ